jgi:hypothetical protein
MNSQLTHFLFILNRDKFHIKFYFRHPIIDWIESLHQSLLKNYRHLKARNLQYFFFLQSYSILQILVSLDTMQFFFLHLLLLLYYILWNSHILRKKIQCVSFKAKFSESLPIYYILHSNRAKDQWIHFLAMSRNVPVDIFL